MRTRDFLSSVMKLAWQMVRKNGYTMSEALKVAWLNMKLKMQMKQKIVRFYYRKVSGEIREALCLPISIQSVANTVLSSVQICFLSVI